MSKEDPDGDLPIPGLTGNRVPGLPVSSMLIGTGISRRLRMNEAVRAAACQPWMAGTDGLRVVSSGRFALG